MLIGTRKAWDGKRPSCLPANTKEHLRLIMKIRHYLQACCTNSPLAVPLPAGRNDIAASMAAAEQEERPAEVGGQAWLGPPAGTEVLHPAGPVCSSVLFFIPHLLQPVPCRRL